MNYLDTFKMPKRNTIALRTSSMTNAFVSGIIPCIRPTEEEVQEALATLGMDADHVVCAYCGDKYTEWDHLNPLVRNKRATGYISEIHNLVPACGKCNQSKGARPWREWILSDARQSPKSRGIRDLAQRIAALDEYESAFQPIRIDLESSVGSELWEEYCRAYAELQEKMKRCQELQDKLAHKVSEDVARRLMDT